MDEAVSSAGSDVMCGGIQQHPHVYYDTRCNSFPALAKTIFAI